jgi:alkanesulfonate monooxygenase SsuD/methylene tetrahydromethanopterin reductase-like flavin-dependent oxidoreductase (luciferase family)
MSNTDNRMRLEGHFKLGIFSPNCSGGLSITTMPDRWKSSWANNLDLGRMLDDAGIDFILPVARWVGYGGESGFHSSNLETITWAAGLLATTKSISVFATIHTAANNPVVVSKQMATLDQIGQGRAGLNIVAGWNKPEYEALGLTLDDEHTARYAYAEEWFDIVRRLWTEKEPFDLSGTFFKLVGVHSDPKPAVAPTVMSAAGSREGREFATRNADFLFTTVIDLERSREEIAAVKRQAEGQGRAIDVLTTSHVVCRPTEQEALDYVKYFAFDHRDDVALDRAMTLQLAHSQSFPPDLLMKIRDRFAMGHGGFPLVGTPEQVADGLQSLEGIGLAGTALSFANYLEEFPYFRDTVLPILEARGMRLPTYAEPVVARAAAG